MDNKLRTIRMLVAHGIANRLVPNENFTANICGGQFPSIEFAGTPKYENFTVNCDNMVALTTTENEALKVLLTLVGVPFNTKSGAKVEELVNKAQASEAFIHMVNAVSGDNCDGGVALLNYIESKGNGNRLVVGTKAVSEVGFGTPQTTNNFSTPQMTEQTQVTTGASTYAAFAYLDGKGNRKEVVVEKAEGLTTNSPEFGSFVTQITSRFIETVGGHRYVSNQFGKWSWETTVRDEQGNRAMDKNFPKEHATELQALKTLIFNGLKNEGAYTKDRNAVIPELSASTSDNLKQLVRQELTNMGIFVRTDKVTPQYQGQFPNLQL